MENSKKEKEEALLRKFQALKEKHQNNGEAEDLDKSDAEAYNGVIPERNFKKNLGCG